MQKNTQVRIIADKTESGDIPPSYIGRKGVVLGKSDWQDSPGPTVWKVKVSNRKTPLDLYEDEFVPLDLLDNNNQQKSMKKTAIKYYTEENKFQKYKDAKRKELDKMLEQIPNFSILDMDIIEHFLDKNNKPQTAYEIQANIKYVFGNTIYTKQIRQCLKHLEKEGVIQKHFKPWKHERRKYNLADDFFSAVTA